MIDGSDDYWRTFPLGPGAGVLNRDPLGVIALSKPAGLLSHPNEPSDQKRSVLAASYRLDGEYYEWTAGPIQHRAYLLNRLDAGTSGVILAARTEALALALRAQFKLQRVKKIYQALVFGSPTPPVQVWRDRLAVQKQGGMVRTERSGNLPAEAHMRLLAHQPGMPPLALIQLEPKTGRSHQLRVQCADRHMPIVGDATYGDFRANREFAKRTGERRMFLHSAETRFDYEWSGRRIAFGARAPLPEEFERCLRAARR
ncbi:MAG TPA: RNA pseudouridine synthase [Opitutaceae bacterium]|nr:RNA pseudouridine synthase [Opitutaceae bacterium]